MDLQQHQEQSAETCGQDAGGQVQFPATPEVETFARRIAHIADANMSVCAGVNGERKQLGAASKTTKAELVAALKEWQ